MWNILLYSSMLIAFTGAIRVVPISDRKFHKPFGLFYYHKKLYWADYLFHSIFAYDLSTRQVSQGLLPGGAFQPWYAIPYEQNPSNLFINNGVTHYKALWDGEGPSANIVKPIFSVETDIVNHTLAFAKVAPNCDLIFGTLGTKLCVDQSNSATYKYNRKSGVTIMLSNQIEAGEVEWNADGTKMYQIDPCGSVVREYSYDPKTGDIFNGRIVFTYQSQTQDTLKAVMFSLTLDTAGNLYLGIYHGGVVLVVNPKSGCVIRTINIPGQVIGSVVWGDKNRETLFVSTGDVPRDFFSGTNLSGDVLTPGSGMIYAVTGLNARGVRRRPMCARCHPKCRNKKLNDELMDYN